MLALPTYCDEMIKPIVIEDAANIGAVDITLTYDESLFVITDVGGGSFDVTVANLEHNSSNDSWVRIGAFQTDNQGLDERVTLCSITLAGNLTDLSSLNMTMNTIIDATPQCSLIDHTVDGFKVTALSPSSLSPTPTDYNGGGGGMSYTTPTPASSPVISSVAGTPVEEVVPVVPTEHVPEFGTEPPSLPPPISSPTAGIVIVAVAAIFGIVVVTRATEEHKKATIATTGIIIVSVVTIIGMMLM